MADTKNNFAPSIGQYVTLTKACKLSRLEEHEILDAVMLCQISVGIIAPFWKGYAVPINSGNTQIGTTNGRYVGDEFVATEKHVSSEHQPAHVVPVFRVRGFWKIGCIGTLGVSDTPIEISFLWPHGDVCRELGEEIMPWGDESMVSLVETQTIMRSQLRFIRSEIEALGIGKPAQMPDLSKPDKLDPRKEKTYLQIIRVLLKELKFDGKKPHSDAESIKALTTKHKVQVPSKTETIAKVITDALNLSD
jgi:hypothetical protein